MRDDRAEDAETQERPEEKAPEEREPGEADDETAEGGRKPPPDDLQDDPAYEPDGPLKGIKGG